MKLYNCMGPNPRIVRMFAAEKGIELATEDYLGEWYKDVIKNSFLMLLFGLLTMAFSWMP